MKKYTQNDFFRDFPDRRAALEYVVKLRNYGVKVYKSKGNIYGDAMGNYYAPLKGLPFEGTKLSLDRWFYAIFLLHYSEFWSVRQFAKHLGITITSAFRILKKLRPLINRKKTFINLLNDILSPPTP